MMLAERNRSITLVMRRWWFARVLMLPLVLVLSLGGLAAAVKVELEGERPEVGGNRFRITLTGEDASVGAEAGSSAPDSAAVPQVLASMPAMGAMPYMETTGTVERLGAGTFRAEVELTMGGTWDITVTLPARPGAAARTFRYAVTTDVAGVVDKNAPDVAGSATLPTTGSAAQGGQEQADPLILGSTRLQRIGVRFAEVQQGTMERLIRTTGTVESDTSRRSEVTLRFPAYVKKVLPKQVGDAVAAGEVLAYVESPELAAAQQEVLFALKIAKGSTTEGSANGPASALPHGTHLDPALGRERLRSMGMSDADIAAVLKKGQAAESIAVRAPMAGTLLQTAARDGARVESGQVLFLIGDLRQNYVIARVFQPDLPFVKVGQKVTLSVPGFDGRTVEGLVDLIYPVVSATEGTAQVRIVPKEPLPWSQLGGALEVRIAAAWHTERMIPLEAVLYAGERTYVFVDRGEGRLQATPVVLGRRNRTHVEVLEGLEPGMKVAASGTFLLSSEANLRSALPKWQSKGAEDRSPSPAPQKSTP